MLTFIVKHRLVKAFGHYLLQCPDLINIPNPKLWKIFFSLAGIWCRQSRILIFKDRKAGTLHASTQRAHRFYLRTGNGFYGLVNILVTSICFSWHHRCVAITSSVVKMASSVSKSKFKTKFKQLLRTCFFRN